MLDSANNTCYITYRTKEEIKERFPSSENNTWICPKC